MRVFDSIAHRLLLRDLSREDREACLAQPSVRSALAFRFFYALAFQSAVLSPLLISLIGNGSLETALAALTAARITIAIVEIPAGAFADVVGARVVLRLGLLLTAIVMLGFVGLAFLPLTGWAWLGDCEALGLIGVMTLQIAFGVAFSLVDAADTIVFLDTVREQSSLSDSQKEAFEGVGTSIRYISTMLAVAVGATWFHCVTLFGLSENAETALQNLVFLGTFVGVLVAASVIGKLAGPRAGGTHASAARGTHRQRGTVRDFMDQAQRRTSVVARSCGRLASDGALFAGVGSLTLVLAVAPFVGYALQVPMSDTTKVLVATSPVWILAYTGQAMLGYWASAHGGRRLFRTIAQRQNRRTSLRSFWSPFALVAGPTLLLIGVLAVPSLSGSDLSAPSRSWSLFLLAAVASVVCFFARGVADPYLRTVLEKHASKESAEVRSSMMSIALAGVAVCFLVQTKIFDAAKSLLPSPDMTETAMRMAATGIAAGAVLLCGLVSIGAALIVRKRPPLGPAGRMSEGRETVETAGKGVQARMCKPELSIVVIGSYRRDFVALMQLCRRLEERGHVVVHPPSSARITGDTNGFVRLSTDPSDRVADVQEQVFRLIDQADLVVLCCPDGRVGSSAALEVGYALSSDVAVVPTEQPLDETLRALLEGVPARTRMLLGLSPLSGSRPETRRNDD